MVVVVVRGKTTLGKTKSKEKMWLSINFYYFDSFEKSFQNEGGSGGSIFF